MRVYIIITFFFLLSLHLVRFKVVNLMFFRATQMAPYLPCLYRKLQNEMKTTHREFVKFMKNIIVVENQLNEFNENYDDT